MTPLCTLVGPQVGQGEFSTHPLAGLGASEAQLPPIWVLGLFNQQKLMRLAEKIRQGVNGTQMQHKGWKTSDRDPYALSPRRAGWFLKWFGPEGWLE